MKPASFWIDEYKLQPHPEGGYYTETYRSEGIIRREALASEFTGDRVYSTGIYFLLENKDFSAFHKIKSDEMWHFYAGEPLLIYVINPDSGELETIKLGSDPENDEVFQAVVPAGTWFASCPADASSYSLVGCTVSPGFDFEDFKMAERSEILRQFPKHAELITRLTR